MSDISESAIKETPEITEALKNASFEEMKSILANAAVDQKLVQRDQYDPSVLIPTAPDIAPRGFGKTVTVNGVRHLLTAATERELAEVETAFYRKQFADKPAATEAARTEAARDEHGRFVSEKTPAERAADDEAKAALQLQFQLGQITAAEYIEKSGAVESYLESKGVPIEELKSTIQEKQGQRFEKSWEDATKEFLTSAVGADWPGGAENMKTLGRLLEENNLVDEPSVETIARAFQHMKEHNLLVENPETAARNAIASATNHESLREIARQSSGVFGR